MITPVTIINKNLYFRFTQLMMYMIFIIDHIHHLINKSKILIFIIVTIGQGRPNMCRCLNQILLRGFLGLKKINTMLINKFY